MAGFVSVKDKITRYAEALYKLLPEAGAVLADLGICAMVILVVINAFLIE